MRALLLHNQLAGQRDRSNAMSLVASRLEAAGWEMEVAPLTDGTDDSRVLRQAVAEGLDVAVVAGGDGSLNIAIQALAGAQTVLGVIPIGTGNVWAKEIGIPLDVHEATEILLRGETALADLGQANGRYFLSIAGVGLDASVMRTVRATTKRRLGVLAYVIAGMVEALKLRGEETTLSANGRITCQRVLMVMVSNIRLYGGVLEMAPEAFVDDGLLDVSVFRGTGLLHTVRHGIKAILGLHRRDPDMQFFQTSRLLVESRPGLPVQLDGDYFCTTPVAIRVAPRTLRVIIPPGPHPQFRCRGSGIRRASRGSSFRSIGGTQIEL